MNTLEKPIEADPLAFPPVQQKAPYPTNAERLMTLRTSAVAVCCCSDSRRSSVRWRNSLSSRGAGPPAHPRCGRGGAARVEAAAR
jgi:hypothetical protein